MDKCSIITFFALLMLAGCTQPANNDNFEFSDQENNFLVDIPSNAKNKYERGNGSMAYATFNAPTTNYLSSDYAIVIYPPISFTSNQYPDFFRTSCADSVKELSIVERSQEIFTVKGKFPGYPCSVDSCDDSKYGMDQYKGRYILCSEHDGKTVLIEVNQITDNPELAEEIFKTFRWIDE